MKNYPDRDSIIIWPDVSDFQPIMHGSQLYREGHRALMYKISEGLHWVSRTGKGNHDQATCSGLTPIPYHFILPGNGEGQAKQVADIIHAHHGTFNGIALVVDVENDGKLRPTPEDCRQFVSTWRNLRTGIPVGGYCAAWYWNQFGNQPSPFDWHITATYNYSDCSCPRDPWWILENPQGGVTPNYVGAAAWGEREKSSEARQFTDAAMCAGVMTDCNVFWGTQSEFIKTVIACTKQPVNNRFSNEVTITQGADDKRFQAGVHPVKDLQNALQSGFEHSTLVDGIFGPKTSAIVRAFQANHLGGQLIPDGIVGQKTWIKLDWMLDWQGK